MAHFGRSGPPDMRYTYSLLVLNVSFRTTADDLFPLFEKYGEVVDVFIPRDQRTGESRGFAFVRYKYADEAQRAVDKLDGRVVDGREIMVQFAKYGPNAERIHQGRIVEPLPLVRGRARSRSPRPRDRGDYRDDDYRRQSRSWSRGRHDHDRYYDGEREYYQRSTSRSLSPDYHRDNDRDRYYDEWRSRTCSSYGEREYYCRSRSLSRSSGYHRDNRRDRYYDERRSRRYSSDDGREDYRRSSSRSLSPDYPRARDRKRYYDERRSRSRSYDE